MLKIWYSNFILWLRKKRYSRAVKRAKRLADSYHKLDGKRYYVLPGAQGELYVYNRLQIKELNKLNGPKTNIDWILINAIYYTK